MRWEPCADRLRAGFDVPDRAGRPVAYRYLADADDIDVITAFLHNAYAPLAAAGMRFMASHQGVDVTRRRLDKGETIVATDGGELVGIVTLADANKAGGSPFYDRPDVATFGQFAVKPDRQARGIGSTLMNLVEERATEHGVKYLALDTSEQATHLIDFYQRRGFAFVEHTRWPDVNYRSVVLAKPLGSDESPRL